MDFNISKGELTQMLNDEYDSIIWTKNVNAFKAWQMFIATLLTYVIILFYYFNIIREIPFTELIKMDGVTLIEITGTIFLAVFFIISYYVNVYIAVTMKYSIRPKYISFEWGYFKKHKIDIPFTDISAVSLVEYTDSEYSTIFFGTHNTYKIKKLDFDNNEMRHHITFEKVKNGKEVTQLLQLLQKEARNRLN